MKIGRRWTWSKIVKGWWLAATFNQMWGIGIIWHGRYNGISINFGPFTFDIQPPAPEWMKGDIAPPSNDDAITTAT